MSRIRSLKPELPTDRTLAALPMEVRYTFLLIISQADDYGLLEANPRQLMGALFPHDHALDAETVESWIDQLVAAGRVRWRETVDGAPVLEVIQWTKHQKIQRPGKPLLQGRLQPLEEGSPLTPRQPDTHPPGPDTNKLGESPNIPRSLPEHPPVTDTEKLGADRERDRERERDQGKGLSPPKASRLRHGVNHTWVAAATALFAEHVGILSHGRVGKALKPAVDLYGWDDGDPRGQHVHRYLLAYLTGRPYQRRDGSIWGDRPDDNPANPPPKDTRFCSPEDFVEHLAFWRERCQPTLQGVA